MEFAFSCFSISISILLLSSVCNGSDTISVGESLLPKQSIISKRGRFELGFFTPGRSSNSYVGIWYKATPDIVVWVLNRNNPIQSSFRDSCLLQVSNSGLELIVNSEIIWRSAVSLNVTEAVILASGNFVLKSSSGGILWQSFDYPTDTWLPGARLGFDWSSFEEAKLVSWTTGDDPASGAYSLGMKPNGSSELFMKKNSTELLWRSGLWTGGTLPMFALVSHLYNFSFVSGEDSAFLAYNVSNEALAVRVALC